MQSRKDAELIRIGKKLWAFRLVFAFASAFRIENIAQLPFLVWRSLPIFLLVASYEICLVRLAT